MSTHLASVLESLLFISGEPISFVRLAKILDTDEEQIMLLVQALADKYTNDMECGLMIIVKEKKALLATKPENMVAVEALTKSSIQENLSKAALEVLSIIAYRSPISRSEIEAIRGVNCSFTIRNLLLRDLIERQDNPKDAREYVYFPTFRLLQSLGLSGTEELPDYKTLSVDERLKMLVDLPETVSGEETETAEIKIDVIEEE
jgi:segregation and condensation protein B